MAHIEMSQLETNGQNKITGLVVLGLWLHLSKIVIFTQAILVIVVNLLKFGIAHVEAQRMLPKNHFSLAWLFQSTLSRWFGMAQNVR